MNASVRVLRPGLHTTVQDLGRTGHLHEGVPVGGAMDAPALRAANLLVGNAESAAALEVTLLGPTLQLEGDVVLAITGADLSARCDDRPLPRGRPVHVRAGAKLTFGEALAGSRAYLAFAGGIAVAPVLGSRSTNVRAGIGGFEGRALKRGDVLPLGTAGAVGRRLAAALAEGEVARWGVSEFTEPHVLAWRQEEVEVRALAGSYFRALTPAARRTLLTQAFVVSRASDRMGYRLDGPRLALRRAIELRSEAVTFGTVQIPPGGVPIVLMADRQTTGGYPRVLEVVSVDLPLLAQASPGTRVRFREVSLETAQRLYLARERELARLAVGVALRLG